MFNFNNLDSLDAVNSGNNYKLPELPEEDALLTCPDTRQVAYYQDQWEKILSQGGPESSIYYDYHTNRAFISFEEPVRITNTTSWQALLDTILEKYGENLDGFVIENCLFDPEIPEVWEAFVRASKSFAGCEDILFSTIEIETDTLTEKQLRDLGTSLNKKIFEDLTIRVNSIEFNPQEAFQHDAFLLKILHLECAHRNEFSYSPKKMGDFDSSNDEEANSSEEEMQGEGDRVYSIGHPVEPQFVPHPTLDGNKEKCIEYVPDQLVAEASTLTATSKKRNRFEEEDSLVLKRAKTKLEMIEQKVKQVRLLRELSLYQEWDRKCAQGHFKLCQHLLDHEWEYVVRWLAKHPEVRSLEFSPHTLTSKGSEALFKEYKDAVYQFEKIVFAAEDYSSACAKCFEPFLQNTTVLQSFSLSGTFPEGNDYLLMGLLENLQQVNTLTSLTLRDCLRRAHLGRLLMTLLKHKGQRLEYLDISHNSKLRDADVRLMLSMLKSIPLKTLVLPECDLWRVLADLQFNSSLTKILMPHSLTFVPAQHLSLVEKWAKAERLSLSIQQLGLKKQHASKINELFALCKNKNITFTTNMEYIMPPPPVSEKFMQRLEKEPNLIADLPEIKQRNSYFWDYLDSQDLIDVEPPECISDENSLFASLLLGADYQLGTKLFNEENILESTQALKNYVPVFYANLQQSAEKNNQMLHKEICEKVCGMTYKGADDTPYYFTGIPEYLAKVMKTNRWGTEVEFAPLLEALRQIFDKEFVIEMYDVHHKSAEFAEEFPLHLLSMDTVMRFENKTATGEKVLLRLWCHYEPLRFQAIIPYNLLPESVIKDNK